MLFVFDSHITNLTFAVPETTVNNDGSRQYI